MDGPGHSYFTHPGHKTILSHTSYLHQTDLLALVDWENRYAIYIPSAYLWRVVVNPSQKKKWTSNHPAWRLEKSQSWILTLVCLGEVIWYLHKRAGLRRGLENTTVTSGLEVIHLSKSHTQAMGGVSFSCSTPTFAPSRSKNIRLYGPNRSLEANSDTFWQ